MKKRISAIAIALSIVSSAAHSAPEPILNFDWDLKNGNQLDDKWTFYPAGDSGCDNYKPEQDKFCSSEHRVFLFYSGYDSDHTGWMRYGAVFPSDVESVSGNALKMVFTGGRADDENGTPQDYGDDVRSYAAYKQKSESGESSLYAERLLPGQPSIYYKARDSNATTLGIFPNSNRFIVHAWMPPIAERHARYSRYNRDNINSPSKSLAWYPFLDSAKSGHYYHHAMNRPYGGWIKVEFDAHPTHNNGGPYNDLHSFTEGGRASPGDGADYFQRIASFAVRFHGIKDSVSPTTIITDEWERDFTPYENEETIANMGVGYDPEQKAFDISLEDKYRCASCLASYEVKYSFSPITNGNFDSAKSITGLENFFIEDDNEANLLVKPNGGYNAVWGKFFIENSDVSRYLNGERIYIAVKDVTERSFEQDEIDKQLVSTPDGDIQMQRLIKVVDVEFREAPASSGLHLPSKIHAKLQEEKNVYFEHEGLSSNADVVSEADYALRAEVKNDNIEHVLHMDPWKTGDYGLVMHSTDESGARVQSSTVVSVDGPLCDYNVNCSTYVLADFSDGDSKLNYGEFNSIYHDQYTGQQEYGIGIIAGNNADYNYQGISGDGFVLTGSELVVFRIKNTGNSEVTVKPKVSSLVKERPATSSKSTWRVLNKFNLYPGEEKEWSVPVQEFSQGYLSNINVSIGAASQDVLLKSISLLTEKELKCVTCDSLLVDFFSTGTIHKAPQSGWDLVIKDAYTNEVFDGMGITVGSNGQYNYQGVMGTRQLSDDFKYLAFYWTNNSSTSYTFSPRYSFNDSDRVISGVTGDWFTQTPITLAPGETFIDHVKMDFNARVINSNVNLNQRGAISLDKIMGVKQLP